MHKFIIRRLLLMIPMLFIITVIVFTLVKMAPGDAMSGEPDPNVSQEALDRQKALYGLDQPPHQQYISWLGNVLQGNFGISQSRNVPVDRVIGERIWNTVFLSVVSSVITILIAIPLGVMSARKPYSLVDYVGTTGAFVGLATPNFIAGILVIYLFAFQLGWLPAQGTATHGQNLEGFESLIDRLKHVILPAFTLGLASTATYMRYMRSEMLEVMGRDFVRTAHAKGLSEQSVLYKHTLRNALIPIITLLGFEFGQLLSGAVITEAVFSWPGLGQLFIESVVNRDYPVIMAINIITAIALLLGNLLADIFYAVVDPRIRYD
ncbi:ABC transporter permease [Caldalkalibacillus salinus]|uniref:ABC transporter permease n=1 Tax=Caldalkalibacillus salinus TaxID=2803787 RepID=UPI001920992B|nr:ABC transporter permease [Caldalkalibacillus salinus]